MEKIIKVKYEAYSGYSFVDKDGNSISNIRDLSVKNKNGLRGKLKLTGSYQIIEHGYSGITDVWEFIDTDINFHSIKNGDEFTTENELSYPNPHKTESYSMVFLDINGMDGTFKYDV